MDYYNEFKALSDSIRLDILNELNDGELSVRDIATKFSLPNLKSFISNIDIEKSK